METHNSTAKHQSRDGRPAKVKFIPLLYQYQT